jgi:hypothetical protein
MNIYVMQTRCSGYRLRHRNRGSWVWISPRCKGFRTLYLPTYIAMLDVFYCIRNYYLNEILFLFSFFLKNIFVYNAFISPFNTQSLFSLKNLYPGGIRTQVFLFPRRMRLSKIFLRCPGWGSEPGICWFHFFSHSITLPLSHSGSPFE